MGSVVSSSWGTSWGSSWGNSWGTIEGEDKSGVTIYEGVSLLLNSLVPKRGITDYD